MALAGRRQRLLLALAALVALVALSAIVSAANHSYKVHDDVPLWANKVGPFHNPRSGTSLLSPSVDPSTRPGIPTFFASNAVSGTS